MSNFSCFFVPPGLRRVEGFTVPADFIARIVALAPAELHARIPGSELFLYPGLGHAAYEEAPDFYSRVFEFLIRDMQT